MPDTITAAPPETPMTPSPHGPGGAATETALDQAIRLRDASSPGTTTYALWNATVKRLADAALDVPVYRCRGRARLIDIYGEEEREDNRSAGEMFARLTHPRGD